MSLNIFIADFFICIFYRDNYELFQFSSCHYSVFTINNAIYLFILINQLLASVICW